MIDYLINNLGVLILAVLLLNATDLALTYQVQKSFQLYGKRCFSYEGGIFLDQKKGFLGNHKKYIAKWILYALFISLSLIYLLMIVADTESDLAMNFYIFFSGLFFLTPIFGIISKVYAVIAMNACRCESFMVGKIEYKKAWIHKNFMIEAFLAILVFVILYLLTFDVFFIGPVLVYLILIVRQFSWHKSFDQKQEFSKKIADIKKEYKVRFAELSKIFDEIDPIGVGGDINNEYDMEVADIIRQLKPGMNYFKVEKIVRKTLEKWIDKETAIYSNKITKKIMLNPLFVDRKNGGAFVLGNLEK